MFVFDERAPQFENLRRRCTLEMATVVCGARAATVSRAGRRHFFCESAIFGSLTLETETMEVSPAGGVEGAGGAEGARPRAPRTRPAPAPSRAARHRHASNAAPASVLAPDSKFKKRKTRRGKSNRWPPNQHRRETHAPYNTNQFLMEEHMPEAQRALQLLHPVESRTRDSSFSVDSDENYFYPLPEDEEDFLTKEFSSVYEDAQSERLTNMTKDELLQEYLLLQGRYDALAKRFAGRGEEISVRFEQQEELIRELRTANQALALQLARANRVANHSSSADSESDSSSSCSTSSSSSSNGSPRPQQMNGHHSPERSLANGGRLSNGEHAHSPAEHPD